jgi:hypothetical protein
VAVARSRQRGGALACLCLRALPPSSVSDFSDAPATGVRLTKEGRWLPNHGILGRCNGRVMWIVVGVLRLRSLIR